MLDFLAVFEQPSRILELLLLLSCVFEVLSIRASVLSGEVGADPGRGANEGSHVLDNRLNTWDNLYGGRAVPDDCHCFTSVVIVVVPYCRMNEMAFEVLQTWDFGPVPFT